MHFSKKVIIIKTLLNIKEEKQVNKLINGEIKARKVKLIEDKTPRVMSLSEALTIASQADMDLVQMTQDDIPVVKVMDYGKYKYELQKREKERLRTQKANTASVKEVQIRPNISIGDLETKARKANEFLAKGDKVKIVVRFRGREAAFKNVGYQALDSFLKLLNAHKIDSDKKESSRDITMVVSP